MNDLPHDHLDKPSAGFLSPALAGRLALAAVPFWLTLSFVTTTGIPVELRAMVLIVAVVSVIFPTEGLCVIAVTVPLGDLVAIALESNPIRLTEALVISFLTGWLLSPARRPERGPAPSAIARYGAFALSALILASMAAIALQMRNHFPELWPGMWSRTLHDYFGAGTDPLGAVSGGRLLEGLGLSAAVVLLLRRRPILAVWIPEALGASCVIVVVAGWALWHGYGLPAVVARHAVLGDRIVAHVPDINAAASYFAMMVCVAAGLAGRERGVRRIWWLAVTWSGVEGLWLSASRAANTAVVLMAVGAAIWLISQRWSKAIRYGVLAAVVAGIIVTAVIRTWQIEADTTASGSGFRVQFAESSYRMIRSHPWLGLGIGQYYQDSSMFLNAQLAWAYGSENAHNYFLQLAAEIGLIGFAAVAALIIGAFWPPMRALARAPDNYRLLGLVTGVLVFLLTCGTGHPFLTPEVAFPFWIAAGLMVALGNASAETPVHANILAKGWLVPAACVLGLAVSIPVRAREALPGPRRAVQVEGLFDWETGADGQRYRWTREYASVFVGREARRVEIPLRAPGQEGSGTDAAEVSVEGSRPISWPIGRNWRVITVDVPYTPRIVQARRINIKAIPTRTLADGRGVGLQMGEPNVIDP